MRLLLWEKRKSSFQIFHCFGDRRLTILMGYMLMSNKKEWCRVLLSALAMLLMFTPLMFAQSSTSLGGTVVDASQAVLPGANVTATNIDTGVETRTTTNNAGVYNFPSLQPGTYNVSAEVSGFQRSTRTNVRLGMGSQIRLNVELAVAGTTTEVEVTSSAENIILESGSSTGTVLQENAITELPLVSNDALELINVMGGVVTSEAGNFAMGDNVTTFAGVTANNINISRDGISVNEIRYSSGITSPARLNPELVGEFKMILSPVDAELGRGAGQLQMITRSGANTFHGSAVWNIQNSALDAYDFSDKDQEIINPRAWRNVNNYTLSLSGPIIRNRTFFFVSWDQQISKSRTSVNSQVLTPCARKGIYRYLTTVNPATGNIEGVRITNTLAEPNMAGSAPNNSLVLPSVDHSTGLPLTSYKIPDDGTRFTGWAGETVPLTVRHMNVLDNSFVWNDSYGVNCENYNMPTSGTAATGWDNYRYEFDKSGFVSRFTGIMPQANDWQVGDGLNTAGHRWTRTSNGAGTVYGGNVYDDNRKAITVKVDHNINEAHRASGTYSYETNNGEDGEALWPENSYGGIVIRKPQTFTITLTSTLLPTVLNEFRTGLSRTSTATYDPVSSPKTGEDLKKIMMELLPTTDPAKFPRFATVNEVIVAGPGYGSMLFHPEGGFFNPYPLSGLNSQPYGSRSNLPTTWGGNDPRWTVADTVTWMRGTHSFKGGFEFRRNKSWQKTNGPAGFADGANVFPSVKGGVMSDYSPFRNQAMSGDPTGSGNLAAPYAPLADVDYTFGVTESGNYRGMYGLMGYMTGSIADISQYFYVTDAKNPRWSDPLLGEMLYVSDVRNREFSFFFKDDWKVSEGLTLNLGVRYEYYGVPWVDSGLAAGVRDSIKGMLGASGLNDLGEWMPNNPTQTSYRTQQIFIGPNSLNSDISAFGKDRNNWAPHVGFSWQLPWFGRGLTTLRGGYSISYAPISNFDNSSYQNGFSYVLANQPGMVYTRNYRGSENCLGIDQNGALAGNGCYVNFDNFGSLLPLYDSNNGFFGLPADQQPEVLAEQPVEKRDQTLVIFDPNVRNPYIQNLTLSLTRNIGSNFTVDVRYIGTLSRKQIARLDLNTANFVNNGLLDELIKIRAGSNNPADFPTLNRYIKPNTLFPGGTTAAEQIRSMYGFDLGSGNLMSVAGNIATANCAFGSSCIPVSGQRGQVLRMGDGEAPDTLIYANPQYASAIVLRNMRQSNYHSMQAQVTMRPMYGLNFQTTYTWSRNLGRAEAITDYSNWGGDYWLLASHRSHQFNFNGNYTLPFGANGFFFRNAGGTFKKAIEGWNFGWIASVTSGIPMAVAGSNTLWANGAMNLVRPDLWDNKAAKAEWSWEDNNGYYLGKKYMRVTDPQCLDSNIVGSGGMNTFGTTAYWCNNNIKALAVIDHFDNAGNPVAGDIVFQNALPGQRGNFQGNNLAGPGRWSLDMNMGKKIEFMEGKTIELRVDAQNILNHATPANGVFAWGPRTYQPTQPSVTINTTSTDWIGLLDTKTGHRTFQAKLRFSF